MSKVKAHTIYKNKEGKRVIGVTTAMVCAQIAWHDRLMDENSYPTPPFDPDVDREQTFNLTVVGSNPTGRTTT